MEKLMPTSLRLPESLKKRLARACVDRDVTQQDAVIAAIEQWLNQPAATEVSVSQKPGVRYRPENLPWHDRLEMTLNDPDEKLGIQKNLEWAERTVTSKLNQPRPAGKRASGE